MLARSSGGAHARLPACYPCRHDTLALFAAAIALKLHASRLIEVTAPHPSYADIVRSLGEQAFAGSAQARALARRLRFSRLLP